MGVGWGRWESCLLRWDSLKRCWNRLCWGRWGGCLLRGDSPNDAGIGCAEGNGEAVSLLKGQTKIRWDRLRAEACLETCSGEQGGRKTLAQPTTCWRVQTDCWGGNGEPVLGGLRSRLNVLLRKRLQNKRQRGEKCGKILRKDVKFGRKTWI